MNTANDASLLRRAENLILYDSKGEVIIESVIEAVHTAMKSKKYNNS